MTGTKSKKRKGGSGISLGIKWGLAILLMGVGLLVARILKDMPNPKMLGMEDSYPESSQIYDRNNNRLFEFYGDKRRIRVEIDSLPKHLLEATIAIEDANFYHHKGFDLKGIARGLYRTVVEGRLQGGSTITQQLVKNGLLTPERTWSRKFREAILTVATELTYDKKKILEMYFNQTPYGGTIWGVGAASRAIFNKTPNDLTIAESALLAGLPGSPTKYSPFANPELAKKRQIQVLKRMEELGYISNETYATTVEEELKYHVSRSNIVAPHFVFYVKDELIKRYGDKMVNEGGLKIVTTLDSEIQKQSEETVAEEVAKLLKYNVTNGAALVANPKTGEILAMVGSKDYWADDIDGKYNVTTALRQPGSAIKPLNYLVGIDSGKVTAASVFEDRAVCFKVENQKPYCPTNYGSSYFGLQNLRNSLASSLNIPAVKMIEINGLETFVASASAMGLESLKNASDYGLSLTLGGGEVKMTDMTVAYGMLANLGLKKELRSIKSVTDRNGKLLDELDQDPGIRVASREASYIIGDILSDDGARSMVFGRGSLLNIKKHPEVSVKTGTTNDLRDNWTFGYTTDFVVATWVGNNDNSKMRGVVSGTSGAAPIWNKIMSQLLMDSPVKKQPTPQDIKVLPVCRQTGMLPPESGCETYNEMFISKYVPKQRMELTNNILIDKDTGRIVMEGESKTNVEWQIRPSVIDVTGAVVCLDCSPAN